MEPVTPEPGTLDGAPLRIAYVLGTTAGGTGPHVAMLAQGCAARGMVVRVFGPAGTAHRYLPGPGTRAGRTRPRGTRRCRTRRCGTRRCGTRAWKTRAWRTRGARA